MRVRVETKESAPVSGKPWTRHYDPDVPASLIYPRVPLQAMLDDAAESHPNSTATIFFNRKRSYKSISDAAWRFANGLRRLGVKGDDRRRHALALLPGGEGGTREHRGRARDRDQHQGGDAAGPAGALHAREREKGRPQTAIRRRSRGGLHEGGAFCPGRPI